MPRLITLTPNPALDFAFDVDRLKANRKLRCSHLRADAGGGGINVARAALRLGAQTLAIFPIGGVFGKALEDAVKAEHVPLRTMPVARATRPAFHAHEDETGDEYRFNFPGEPLSPAELETLLAALEEETQGGDWVVGSGSLPPETAPDFWARAAKLVKGRGADFALDSSVGVKEALAEGVSLLRLNKHEAPTLAGRDLDWPEGAADFAWSLVERGAAARVVITHGDEGGVLVSEAGVTRSPTFDVEIVSAVGAGDSFVAALVVSLMKGDSEARALRRAFAAASASLTTPGTALFDPALVERLFETGKP